MPFCRASELDRLLHCQGSLYLSHAPKQMGESARWGNIVHAWVETGEFTDDRDGKALKKRVMAAKVDRPSLWPLSGEFEIALALNLDTLKAVRYLPTGDLTPSVQRAARDAWKAAFDRSWITGSPDYVGELLDSPWVDDLKTGRYASWPDFAAQQSFYSLAYSLWKYKEIRETRSTVTHWTRYPVGNRPVRKGVVLTVEYLEQFLEKLIRLRQNYTENPLWAGDHCRWCPAQNNCDEYSRLRK